MSTKSSTTVVEVAEPLRRPGKTTAFPSSSPFHSLPAELRLHIISYLPSKNRQKTLVSLMRCCSDMNSDFGWMLYQKITINEQNGKNVVYGINWAYESITEGGDPVRKASHHRKVALLNVTKSLAIADPEGAFWVAQALDLDNASKITEIGGKSKKKKSRDPANRPRQGQPIFLRLEDLILGPLFTRWLKNPKPASTVEALKLGLRPRNVCLGSTHTLERPLQPTAQKTQLNMATTAALMTYWRPETLTWHVYWNHDVFRQEFNAQKIRVFCHDLRNRWIGNPVMPFAWTYARPLFSYHHVGDDQRSFEILELPIPKGDEPPTIEDFLDYWDEEHASILRDKVRKGWSTLDIKTFLPGEGAPCQCCGRR
ncbi:hypothetical protein CI109_106235 [Kwoniella shandongensis]|uniref:Uncharacterized protein n=1 Tax=Kwoniella shandongensis TaxID=1734106 RepID=A0A5M6BYE2_9TREE|nr:uncharacterized protein CI109_003839 [Kwoniella shandongensis]KAA5527867.1 hypothetical protein CI109_003839 [Kwoniella shandongensis]